MYSKTFIFFCCCLGLLNVSCNVKPTAVGSGGTLVVIIDEEDRAVVGSVLEEIFSQEIITPQPEPFLSIVWTDGELLSNHIRNPVLLLVSTLKQEGPTSNLLGRMLTADIEVGFMDGEYEIFKLTNTWANNQMLSIIGARDRAELLERVTRWGPVMLEWIKESEYERLRRDIYRKGEQKNIERELFEKFNVSLRVQHDYVLAETNDTLNYYRLFRRLPERWLTVHWGKLDDVNEFTAEFMFERRREMGSTFLDPIELYDDYWSWEESRLLGQPMILVRGVWATVEPIGGGPFFSYGIICSETGKYYIVDGAVFSPGREKMPFIWQLEAIAQTLRIGER